MPKRLVSFFARIACAAGLLTVASSPARAWSQVTHSTTGEIAWIDLSRSDPAALKELMGLVRQHQDYSRFLPFIARLSPPTQERALLAILARWPDDIRGSSEDHPDWHYQARVVYGRTWLWPFENGNAEFGFGYNYTVLANHCAAPVDRARAIGWLIHIVGDVQQPLHAGHQMTAQFPGTDRLGSVSFVRRPSGKVTELHEFWDQTMEESGVMLAPGQSNWGDALAAMWPREKLAMELGRQAEPAPLFRSFLDESAELARLFGYTGTFLAASPDAAHAPIVTAREQRVAIALAERRIATGGYRIADILKRALAESHSQTWACPEID